jgi:DNA invertase Pin-like site-specific DNA recombinase
MRCALYARFSNDDRQNQLSAEDQLIMCRRRAEARGWEVVADYRDEGISGAAMANRPGLLSALAAAGRGDFEVLLTEDESRIARNLGHLAFVRDEMEAAGVTLSTLQTDTVELMHVAFKGAFAQQYLVDLGLKTARGMRRNAEKGLATGARIYGYRSQPGGRMEIVEPQAEIVRRIFREYVAGGTAREIAAGLNRDGVPGGRGGRWSASSITGSRQRGNGVVRCELYAGVKVWGRMTVLKDHRTGRRRPKLKPRSEWQRTPVPELAIVPAPLWSVAQVRVRETEATRPERLMRRPGLFSGLLKCGLCGGAYTVYNAGRLICAAHRDSGACAGC